MNNKVPSDITTAYIPARILAALIDYFFIVSTASFFDRIYPLEDLSFITFLTLAAFYYTIANSVFFNGQTLGKKFFGLRTVSIAKSSSRYISLSQSFLRFLLLLGLVVALKEAPPIFYRHFLVESSRSLLDLPILFSFVLFFGNISTLLFHTHQRALHDIIGKSAVIRNPNNEPIENLNLEKLKSSHHHPIVGFSVGSILACIFWSLSILQPPQLQAVSEKQYAIEASLSIKILHATFYDTTLSLITLVSSADQSLEVLCSDVLRKVQDQLSNNLKQQSIAAIEMRCIDKAQHSKDITFKVDLSTNQINRIENPFLENVDNTEK